MEEFLIKAEQRKGTGKSVTRKLRREGRIPAVLYGRDTKSLPVTVSWREWERLSRHLKRNAILTMQLQGTGDVESRPVMVKEIQRALLGDKILHIDFLQVSMERRIEVEIPIHLVGTAKGVEKEGIVDQHLRTIMAECLPAQIPEKVEVDVSALDIGDSIHVNEISIPGVKLLENPDVAIVTVVPPRAEEKPEVVEEIVVEKKEE
jgi:large subunit ribosomal protein L25